VGVITTVAFAGVAAGAFDAGGEFVARLPAVSLPPVHAIAAEKAKVKTNPVFLIILFIRQRL
jgi:hypothetical protein